MGFHSHLHLHQHTGALQRHAKECYECPEKNFNTLECFSGVKCSELQLKQQDVCVLVFVSRRMQFPWLCDKDERIPLITTQCTTQKRCVAFVLDLLLWPYIRSLLVSNFKKTNKKTNCYSRLFQDWAKAEFPSDTKNNRESTFVSR